VKSWPLLVERHNPSTLAPRKSQIAKLILQLQQEQVFNLRAFGVSPQIESPTSNFQKACALPQGLVSGEEK
jgi:hypothetical protein